MSMSMSPHRQRLRPQSLLAFLAAAALAASLLSAASNNDEKQYPLLLRSSIIENVLIADTSQKKRRQLDSLNLDLFNDPKSVETKSDAPIADDVDNDAAAPTAIEVTREKRFTPINHRSRDNCQIVYVLGVEGAAHHGFVPILENLARHQIDPTTSTPYSVNMDPLALKSGLFGWHFHHKIKQAWGFEVTPEVGDPALVQQVLRESCPNDGKKHVLIEWATFPTGKKNDRRTYRVQRAHEWLDMSPEEIADSEEASNHPTDIEAFYRAYSPYVDIKFVVLHRPFLETIASRKDWDGGPVIHSNIIRGFMLVLRRFLDTHLFDLVTGRRLWSLVCVDKIMAKNYDGTKEVDAARGRVLNQLAEFLGWPSGDCEHCFDHWKGSRKNPIRVLGKKNVPILMEHMEWLEGVWPPPGEEGIAEQQCEM